MSGFTPEEPDGPGMPDAGAGRARGRRPRCAAPRSCPRGGPEAIRRRRAIGTAAAAWRARRAAAVAAACPRARR
ncbi:hypothetical protein [Conexibacter woesei]|uniref:hypothetical protein n=1 Tax=Conexibacter woesei TaxID=191495 RepID=UPI00031552D8|nr:hypothetical protein [Conexibacter woesei]